MLFINFKTFVLSFAVNSRFICIIISSLFLGLKISLWIFCIFENEYNIFFPVIIYKKPWVGHFEWSKKFEKCQLNISLPDQDMLGPSFNLVPSRTVFSVSGLQYKAVFPHYLGAPATLQIPFWRFSIPFPKKKKLNFNPNAMYNLM